MTRMGTAGKAAIGTAWVFWFAALTATPFFLAEPYRGPVLTGFYGWVALGLLIGCLLGAAWSSAATTVLHDRVKKFLATRFWVKAAIAALFAVGWLLAIAISAAELASLPVALECDPEIIYDAMPLHPHAGEACFLPFPVNLVFDTPWRLLVEEYGKICLLVSALLCALVPCVIGLQKPGANQQLKKNDFAGASILSPMVFALACTAGFSKAPLEFSAFHREARVPSLAQVFDGEMLWSQFGLSPAVMLPGIAALLLAAMWCFGLTKRLRGDHGGAACDGAKREISLFPRWDKTCRVLAVYAFGAIAWNFLSRSILVYDKMPHWGWFLLSGLYVIAVLGLVAEGFDARCESQRLCDEGEKISVGDASAKGGNGPSLLEAVSGIELHDVFGGDKAKTLTEREQQALGLMLAGSTSAQSAVAMGVGASTVRAYLQRAYRKLELGNGDEASSVYQSYREMRLRSKAQTQGDDEAVTVKMSNRPCAALNIAGILVLIAAAWVLVPAGAFDDTVVAAGAPLVFGLGTGFMLFGIAEWCGVKPAVQEGATRALIVLAIALWVVLVFLRLSLVVEVSHTLVEGATFVASLCIAFAVAEAVKGSAESKDDRNDGDYRLAASLEVSVWLMVTVLFIGLFVQMAWADLDRPMAATLLTASWTIFLALMLTGRLVGMPRVFAVALLAMGILVTAAGQGSLIMPVLTFLTLGLLVVVAPLLPSRLGPVSVALGVGLTFGRIATNFCNDLMDYYTWVFDNLDPSDVLFPMIGFAAAMVLLVVVAYGQVKLYRETKSEYDLRQTARLFGRPELIRAEAYLVAKGFSPTEVSVGLGILQGYSATQISEGAYLSRGTVNNACLMLYRRLGANSRAQFANAIKDALDLGGGARVLH